MSFPLIGHAPTLVNNTGRRIVIDFATTEVVGALRFWVSYEGCPEGWGFVHHTMCDALKQVAESWDKSRVAPQLVIQGNGEKH
jgi:hypothetical protein